MIKSILIALIMTISLSLIAQDHSTYEDFYKNRWEVPYNWAKKDTIILNRSQKRTTNRWGYEDYGEYISFKEDKKVSYERYLSCPVGATYTTIENFLTFENKAYIYYKTKSWDASADKWKKKHQKYSIQYYDDSTMILVRI